MIKLRNLLLEAAQKYWKGANAGKKGRVQMCHLNSRIYYFKNKKNGVRYCEGQVFVPLEYGSSQWIDHAWNLNGNEIVDVTYGPNNYQYRGNVVREDSMYLIPSWAEKMAFRHNSDPKNKNDQFNLNDLVKTLNFRVSGEFGKKVFE